MVPKPYHEQTHCTTGYEPKHKQKEQVCRYGFGYFMQLKNQYNNNKSIQHLACIKALGLISVPHGLQESMGAGRAGSLSSAEPKHHL